MTQVYPDSIPEFRILRKEDGSSSFQIRYVKPEIGYVGKWNDVPIVEESEENKKRFSFPKKA